MSSEDTQHGEKPPLRCRAGFHRWEVIDTEIAGGFVKRATDECQRCGKRQQFEYYTTEEHDIWGKLYV